MNANHHSRHRRHSSHPGFSQLLTTVLGSPFLTTADLPELVDGAPVFVPHHHTITRPSSPTPTVDSSSFSFIHFDPENATSTPNRPPIKSILPRIWDVLTPSRTFPPSPTNSPFNYNYSYGSLRGRTKSRYFDEQSQYVDYSELAPLDGEEGELIAIDDEACFFIDPAFGSRAVTGIDILALLPTELALHILILLSASPAATSESLQTLLACHSVSRTWRTLTGDNTVWRALFLARWSVDLTRCPRRLRTLPPVPLLNSTVAAPDAVWRMPPPVTPPPTPTKVAKMRAGMGMGVSMGMSMTIKKRKMKKLLASADGNTLSSSSSSLPSSSSFPSPSSRTPSGNQPRRFFTPPPNFSGSRYPFPCPPSPSPSRIHPSGYHAHVPAPAPIQHPRIASAPGDLNRYSMSSPVMDTAATPSANSIPVRDRNLAHAPLQINWHALYRVRLELDRRWAGTAVVQPEPPFSAHAPTSGPAPVPAYTQHLQHPPYPPTNPFLPQLPQSPSSSASSSYPFPSPQPLYAPSPSHTRTLSQTTQPVVPFAPQTRAITGHTDSVYCLEFDARRIVTGSRDRTIKVWSLRDGRLLGSFGGAQVQAQGGEEKVRGHEGSVLCLKFSVDWDAGEWDGDEDEDGERERERERKRGFMVSGSSDCAVCVWDLWTGARLPLPTERGCLPGGENSGDGEGRDGERRWEREVKGEVRAVLRGHAGGVLDLRIDETWIVSCSKDAVIRVWDRATLALARTLRGHEGPVNAVGLQSGRVVSASGDGKMILWDIKSGERVRTFEGHDRGLACIEFKDDLIVSGSNDCKIKIWSAATGECIRTLVGHEGLVRALAFDPKSGRLVSASYDRTVKVWDLGSGKLIREFKNTPGSPDRFHTSHIFDVKFDASRIVSTSHDQKIVVIDFSQGLDTTLFV